MVNYGFSATLICAVIEASALAPDGRVWLTSGIGNAPTWLLRRRKVIINSITITIRALQNWRIL
ncbi:hypothetical protein ACLK1T_18150 [Escherichia coli]